MFSTTLKGVEEPGLWKQIDFCDILDSELPELLPCGYLVGDSMTIRLTLKGEWGLSTVSEISRVLLSGWCFEMSVSGTKQNSVDSLAFDTLIPKSIIHRYVSLLTEHRRIILCGPSGTGKTYLAHKLAEFLVLRLKELVVKRLNGPLVCPTSVLILYPSWQVWQEFDSRINSNLQRGP